MKYPANQYEKCNQHNRKRNKRMNTYHRHVSVLKKQESEKHKKILSITGDQTNSSQDSDDIFYTFFFFLAEMEKWDNSQC